MKMQKDDRISQIASSFTRLTNASHQKKGKSIPPFASLSPTRDEAQTDDAIDETIAIADAILESTPSMELLDKVSAVNRYLGLVVLYPRNSDFRHSVADALDDLASLLETDGNLKVVSALRRISASSRPKQLAPK
jgi:hypothetical protein